MAMPRLSVLVFLLVAIGTVIGVLRACRPTSSGQAPTTVEQAPPAYEAPPRLALPPARPDARSVAGPILDAARDEAALMQAIRANVKSNPALAEASAREARQRFGDSADADERDALLVDALINQQRIGAARSETYYYLEHHPNGGYADHLVAMTGVHPRPKR